MYAVCGGIAMRPLKRKVSITLDEDVIGMIRRFSEKEDRSFSQCVNMLLQKERDSMQSVIYCDYEFCVYQFRGRCMCGKMQIDETGVCEYCLYVELPESVLTRYKAETRRKEEAAEREYEKWRNKPSAK